MSRDVCGICWGAYDENGQCECIPAPVVRDDTALLKHCLEVLLGLRDTPDTIYWYEQGDELIDALKERLRDPCKKVEL